MGDRDRLREETPEDHSPEEEEMITEDNQEEVLGMTDKGKGSDRAVDKFEGEEEQAGEVEVEEAGRNSTLRLWTSRWTIIGLKAEIRMLLKHRLA